MLQLAGLTTAAAPYGREMEWEAAPSFPEAMDWEATPAIEAGWAPAPALPEALTMEWEAALAGDIEILGAAPELAAPAAPWYGQGGAAAPILQAPVRPFAPAPWPFKQQAGAGWAAALPPPPPPPPPLGAHPWRSLLRPVAGWAAQQQAGAGWAAAPPPSPFSASPVAPLLPPGAGHPAPPPPPTPEGPWRAAAGSQDAASDARASNAAGAGPPAELPVRSRGWPPCTQAAWALARHSAVMRRGDLQLGRRVPRY